MTRVFANAARFEPLEKVVGGLVKYAARRDDDPHASKRVGAHFVGGVGSGDRQIGKLVLRPAHDVLEDDEVGAVSMGRGCEVDIEMRKVGRASGKLPFEPGAETGFFRRDSKRRAEKARIEGDEIIRPFACVIIEAVIVPVAFENFGE